MGETAWDRIDRKLDAMIAKCDQVILDMGEVQRLFRGVLSDCRRTRLVVSLLPLIALLAFAIISSAIFWSHPHA